MLVKRLVTHNVTDGKYMTKLNERSVADGRQAIIFCALGRHNISLSHAGLAHKYGRFAMNSSVGIHIMN